MSSIHQLAVLFALFGFVIAPGALLSQTERLSDSDLAAIALRAAVQLDKGLPKKTDEDTTWIKTIAVNNRIVYFYRFEYQSSDVDSNIFDTEVRKLLRDRLCNTPESVKELEMGLAYQFDYTSQDGEYLTNITFEDKDCL